MAVESDSNSMATQSPIPAFRVHLDKSDGSYVIAYKTLTSEGKSRWKTKHASGCRSKDEAERYYREVFAPTLNPLTTEVPADPTICGLAPRWLEWCRVQDPTVYRRVERVRQFEGNIRVWVAPHALGKIPIERITRADARRFIVDMRRKGVKGRGISPSTVQNCIRTLRTLVDDAIREGWIGENTVNIFDDRIVVGEIGKVEKVVGGDVIIHLTGEQLGAFLASPRVDRDRRIFWTVAAATGLRAAELAGLWWGDVDLECAVPCLRVRRQIRPRRHSKDNSGWFKQPKSGSFGAVPLHPLAVERLRAWKAAGWEQMVGRAPTEADCVFPDRRGNPKRQTHAAENLRADLLAAGLPTRFTLPNGETVDRHGKPVYLTLRSLRASFATMVASLTNRDEVKVGQLLRHKPTSMAGRAYMAPMAVTEADLRLICALPIRATKKVVAKAVAEPKSNRYDSEGGDDEPVGRNADRAAARRNGDGSDELGSDPSGAGTASVGEKNRSMGGNRHE